jgi:hypothetical protein
MQAVAKRRAHRFRAPILVSQSCIQSGYSKKSNKIILDEKRGIYVDRIKYIDALGKTSVRKEDHSDVSNNTDPYRKYNSLHLPDVSVP